LFYDRSQLTNSCPGPKPFPFAAAFDFIFWTDSISLSRVDSISQSRQLFIGDYFQKFIQKPPSAQIETRFYGHPRVPLSQFLIHSTYPNRIPHTIAKLDPSAIAVLKLDDLSFWIASRWNEFSIH
jgi:hypothetical protein